MDYILLWLVLVRSIVLTVFLILVSYRGVLQRNASKLLIASAFAIMVISSVTALVTVFLPAALGQFFTNLAHEAADEIVPEVFFVLGLIIIKPKFEKYLTAVYWALVFSLVPLYPVLVQYVDITAPLFGLSDIVLYTYLCYWARNVRLLAVGSSVGVFAVAGIADELGLLLLSNILLLLGAIAMFSAFLVRITLAGEERVSAVAMEGKPGVSGTYEILLRNEQARKRKEDVERRLKRFWW